MMKKYWIIAILFVYSWIMNGTNSFQFNTSTRKIFGITKNGSSCRRSSSNTNGYDSFIKGKQHDLAATMKSDDTKQEETEITTESSMTMKSNNKDNNNNNNNNNNNKNNKKKDFQIQTRNPLRWLVLRLGFTEPAMTSPFNYGKYDGTFQCAYCGQILFDSNSKYDSGSGWPSFWRTHNDHSITYKQELDGRLECRCSRCSSHLGHVFLDGPNPTSVNNQLLQQRPTTDPRGRYDNSPLPRFCMNGAAMTFEKRKKVCDNNNTNNTTTSTFENNEKQ